MALSPYDPNSDQQKRVNPIIPASTSPTDPRTTPAPEEVDELAAAPAVELPDEVAPSVVVVAAASVLDGPTVTSVALPVLNV